MERMMYLFAYGTLQQERSNHGYLTDSEYLGRYFTDNNYALFVSGLPYMVERPKSGGVEGELYKITPETLKELDYLEGHPSFYCRKEITVYDFESGSSVTAWAYLHPDRFHEAYHVPQRKY